MNLKARWSIRTLPWQKICDDITKFLLDVFNQTVSLHKWRDVAKCCWCWLNRDLEIIRQVFWYVGKIDLITLFKIYCKLRGFYQHRSTFTRVWMCEFLYNRSRDSLWKLEIFTKDLRNIKTMFSSFKCLKILCGCHGKIEELDKL